MAAGTLTGPAMAAESQQEGTADSASQEVQEETKLPPDPEGTVTWPIWTAGSPGRGA